MELSPSEVTQLWFHYEEIAMHFNELILQYRIQLMGGAGVLGTIFAYLIGSKSANGENKHWVRFVVSFVLLVIITAAASLDVFYYDKLLSGAVKAIIELEEKYPHINMSTLIKKETSGNYVKIIYLVYGLIITPLLGFTIWAWREHGKNKGNG